MKAQSEIVLDRPISDHIRGVALEYNEDPSSIANEAMEAGLELVRKRRLFRAGVSLPEIQRAKEILNAHAGNEPPQPGDELPEGYRRRA